MTTGSKRNRTNNKLQSDKRLYTSTGTEAPWYQGWNLTETERAVYSERSKLSAKARLRALSRLNAGFAGPVNKPKLNPADLMPRCKNNGLRSLSLFSGGGGLDLGFDLAGFEHIASFELLTFAAETLTKNRPNWSVYGGITGDVTSVDWDKYQGKIDIIHGGPPCQPFSNAERRSH